MDSIAGCSRKSGRALLLRFSTTCFDSSYDRVLQTIGTSCLAICCSPQDVRDAAHANANVPDGACIAPVGAAFGLQYDTSLHELAISGDALRCSVLSGAKGKIGDLQSMFGQIGLLHAGFADGFGKIRDNYLNGLSPKAHFHSQRVGVFQDLKTKTEIGELGWRWTAR